MGDQNNKDGLNQSLANRVLLAFIKAVAEEKDLSEAAPRLEAALLHSDNLKEHELREV
jgi:hypothetical protein